MIEQSEDEAVKKQTGESNDRTMSYCGDRKNKLHRTPQSLSKERERNEKKCNYASLRRRRSSNICGKDIKQRLKNVVKYPSNVNPARQSIRRKMAMKEKLIGIY